MAVNVFGGGGGGGAGFGVVGGVPLTGSEDNLIAGYNFDGDVADLGPSTFLLDGGTPAYNTAAPDFTYDGLRDSAACSTANLFFTTEGAASGAAFQIPVATDISFGGMFYLTSATESTPYLISNSTAATNINYAMVGHAGEMKFQTSAALVSTNWTYELDRWFHLAFVSTSSRTSTQFYLNGRAYGSPLVTTATTPHADSELYFGTVTATNGDCDGGMANCFVADKAYTAGEILDLAQNGFGHALPTLPATNDPA